MFGLSKNEKIAVITKELEKTKKMAKHTHEQKSLAEEQAFYDLIELAREKNITAKEASKTSKGKKILINVVLNRQYAFYLNELAIQQYCELKKLIDPTIVSRILDSNENWIDDVVLPVTSEIIEEQLLPICNELINDADNYMKE